jgi:anti-sigma factor RsiW
MTMHDEWADKLSDYLDGELPQDEHRAIAAHIRNCTDCARTVDELKTVILAASKLTPREPPADLWSGIAQRTVLSHETHSRSNITKHFSFTWPQRAAAGVLLAIVSGWAATRLLAPATRSAVVPGTIQTAAAPASDVVAALSVDDVEYDAAVAELQTALQTGREHLDPTTVAVVEQNLTIIDRAVDDARRALADDPANGYLSGYLVETRERKLDLLRQAAALTEETY